MTRDCDVLVVGAGPAGARVARNLALSGSTVIVVEEHMLVGEPCHCSGLVTPRTLQAADAGAGLHLNSIRGATFHSPDGTVLRLTSPSVAAVAIDRIELDRRLVAQAVEVGAELRLGTKFVSFRLEGGVNDDGGAICITLEEGHRRTEVAAKLLVGADGALSRVGRQLRGGSRPGRLVRALGGEAEYQGNGLGDHVQVFLDERAAPGWFGWTIPLSAGRARLGTGTTNGVRPGQSLSMLQSHFPAHFGGSKILSRRAGCIPVWEPTCMAGDRVMLVGDAARQVKPASGGGILLALVSAEMASQEAAAALADGNLSADRLARYSKLWDYKLGRELRRQHDMRRAISGLDQRNLQALLRTLARHKERTTLETAGDIDFPSGLVWRLLLRNPLLVVRSAVIPRWPSAWLSPRRPRIAGD